MDRSGATFISVSPTSFAGHTTATSPSNLHHLITSDHISKPSKEKNSAFMSNQGSISLINDSHADSISAESKSRRIEPRTDIGWVRIGIIHHLAPTPWLLLPHEDLVLDIALIPLTLPVQLAAIITPFMIALARSKLGLIF